MGVGRRVLLQGLAAAAAVTSYVDAIAQPSVQAQTARRRILIKGGYVASLDKSVGDLPVGDVLIDGATIATIGKDIQASDAEVIDQAGIAGPDRYPSPYVGDSDALADL